jgi:hypothetical protein
VRPADPADFQQAVRGHRHSRAQARVGERRSAAEAESSAGGEQLGCDPEPS